MESDEMTQICTYQQCPGWANKILKLKAPPPEDLPKTTMTPYCIGLISDEPNVPKYGLPNDKIEIGQVKKGQSGYTIRITKALFFQNQYIAHDPRGPCWCYPKG